MDASRTSGYPPGVVHLHQLREALARPARPSPDPHARKAAVAAILTPELELIYTLRSTYEGDRWSGQVSFPGGREEADDPSPLYTAVRETREEVGLDLRRAELLGPLDPLSTIGRPHMVIHPFVFLLREDPLLELDAREVVSVHRVGIDALLAGTGRGSMVFQRDDLRMRLPCVDFDGVRLWGLTLHMTDDLLHRLDGRGMGAKRPTGQEAASAPAQ